MGMDTAQQALGLFQRLRELLERGLTHKAIGEQLALKPAEVSALACLFPDKGRKRRGDLSESQKERIFQLRLAGKTTQEVVHAFAEDGEGILPKDVLRADQELYRAKRFPWRIQTLQSERRKRDWWQENKENVEEVIRLKQQLHSYSEIATILGISYPKVCQEIVPCIVSKYGEEVFMPRPDNPFWTVAQAAKEVGLPKNAIHALCHKGLIPYERRGLGMRHFSYVLKREGVDALRNISAP